VCLINYNKLKRNIHDDIGKIEKENLITSDEYLEFVKLRGNSGSSHSDVQMVPLIILYAPSARLAILIVVQDAIHVGPFFYCSFPVLQS